MLPGLSAAALLSNLPVRKHMSRQIKRINPKKTATKRAVAGTVAGAVLVGLSLIHI